MGMISLWRIFDRNTVDFSANFRLKEFAFYKINGFVRCRVIVQFTPSNNLNWLIYDLYYFAISIETLLRISIGSCTNLRSYRNSWACTGGLARATSRAICLCCSFQWYACFTPGRRNQRFLFPEHVTILLVFVVLIHIESNRNWSKIVRDRLSNWPLNHIPSCERRVWLSCKFLTRRLISSHTPIKQLKGYCLPPINANWSRSFGLIIFMFFTWVVFILVFFSVSFSPKRQHFLCL